MGKKMKFPFLFKAIQTTTTSTSTSAASPWRPWPNCTNNPKTLSFRATTNDDDNIYKTFMNSAYLHDDEKSTKQFANDTPRSFFSFCNSIEHYDGEIFNVDSAVIRGLRSDRLFFEPGETSSILEEAKTHDRSPYKKRAVAIMEMDSRDPFLDFRDSMAEMMEAHHGIKDNYWEYLEELLACYLRVNGKSSHGYILGAFVDLLIDHYLLLASASDDSSTSSAAIDENCSSSLSTDAQGFFISPLSFSSSTYSSTSLCLASMEKEDEIVTEKKEVIVPL